MADLNLKPVGGRASLFPVCRTPDQPNQPPRALPSHYLVAAEILQDDDFLAEMERLASSFGIGIIHLDLEDIDDSRILYPARLRDSIDWETINKLCDLNPDFAKFLQDVRIDVESKRIFRSEYDEVITDVTSYIKDRLKIDPGFAGRG